MMWRVYTGKRRRDEVVRHATLRGDTMAWVGM